MGSLRDCANDCRCGSGVEEQMKRIRGVINGAE